MLLEGLDIVIQLIQYSGKKKLYSFPSVFVTNYLKMSGLKQRNFYVLF